MKAQAAYLAYAGGWRAVRLMPEPMAYATFDRIADRQWQSRAPSVRRLEANLARVLGPVAPDELRSASREGMRSAMRYWCDAFRLPSWDTARINTLDARNPQGLAGPVESGRGTICALPHMGNWDHAGAWGSLNISPVHSVAEKLEPERLFRAFIEFRESLGMHIYGLGDPGVYGQLRAALEGGGLVALLADRDLSASGVDVEFFGATARFPAGPAALAVDTGAALMPASLFWEGHNVVQVLPEIAPPTTGDREERIRVMTQAVARAFEGAIAEHPTDWHMLQRLWLEDLDPSRLAASDGTGGAS